MRLAHAEEVEAARIAEDAAPGAGLVARLALGEAQRRALEAPPFPAAVGAALRDPARAFGRFVILERLGSGGMGDVWRAWDLRLARTVALKVLRRFGDERARACFEREARLLAGLVLPDVPAIHEVGEHDGRPFIAMQLVEGTTLAALPKPVAPRRAAGLIRAAARVVEAAHRARVLHRDLKPSNLMLDGTGRLLVMDFGLARPLAAAAAEGDAGDAGGAGGGDGAEDGAASSLTASAILVGTPEYMPPEQARGAPGAALAAAVDARSDVYALGACLFELLTGRPPFVSKDRGDVIAQVLRDPPPHPSALAPGTPAALEAVTLRCLEKDPARRYPSAGALATDLDGFLAGGRVVAGDAPPLAPRRRATLVAGGVVAAVAMAIVALAGDALWPAPAPRTPAPGAAASKPALTRAAEPVLLWRGAPADDVRSLAIDGDRVLAGIGTGMDGAAHAIVALPLEGGAARPEWLLDAPAVIPGIALAGDGLFWVDPSSAPLENGSRAYRVPRAGGGTPIVIYEGRPEPDGAPIEEACGLATDGRWLYVVDEVGGGVVRLGLDGSGLAPVAPPRYAGGFETAHKNAIAVDGDTVFVADAGMRYVTQPEVVAADAAGGPWREVWRGAPLVRPRAVAARGGTLYVADAGAGNAIWALPAEGGAAPRLVRAGPPFVDLAALALAGDALILADSGDAVDARGDAVAGPPAIWRVDLARE